MERKSISALKQLFETDVLTEKDICELKMDERKGVQSLLKSYEQKKLKEQALEEQFKEMCQYEERAFSNDCKYIAGIDEAGRGPLAGPVVAAAVMLPRDFKLLGLNDSKQLNEATRERFFDIIKNEALSFGISIISNQQIDQINIYEASKLAMREAINQLNLTPDHVLIDAVKLEGLSCSSESIIKGDQKSISIAAASVVAKVTRDRLMKKIHREFPVYDFASNMGYGTKRHLDALKQVGITPYHRKSYAPVRNVIN